MKKFAKKIICLLMVTCFVLISTAFQTLAGALSESVIGSKQKLYISYYPYSYNFAGSGLGTSIYGDFVKINVGSSNGEYAYCMDVTADSGITGTSTFKAEDFNLSNWIKDNCTSEQIKLMSYASMYVVKRAGENKYGYSDEVENISSQIINWTILHEWFNTSSETKVLNVYTANMPSSVASDVKACYKIIKEQILSHKTVPSYAAPEGQTPTAKKMTANSDGTFTLTLTDSNNVSKYYDWATAIKNYSYLSITTDTEGKLVLKSIKPIANAVTLTSARDSNTYQSNIIDVAPMFLISDGGSQTSATFVQDYDPSEAKISIYTDSIGTAQIKKVWQHNGGQTATNADIYFTIKNSSGATVKATGSAGS